MKDADTQIIATLREILARTGGGAAAVWGAITGTLGNQTDLSNALALKQTAAQVQALIDAALAGRGVIGTAVVVITDGAVDHVQYQDGIFTGSAFSFSSGILTWDSFNTVQSDANYIPGGSFAGSDTKYLSQVRQDLVTVNGFSIAYYAYDDGTAAANGYARIWVMRVSQ